MALSELAALEAAYEVLQPLDDAGRRRALQWLTDALNDRKALVQKALTGGSAKGESQDATLPLKGRSVSKRTAASASRTSKSVPVPKKRGGPRAVAGRAPQAGQRVRRPMPSGEEIMAAYEQAGTINGLADHFEVPIHTVYSWARKLRSEGYDIGRAR